MKTESVDYYLGHLKAFTDGTVYEGRGTNVTPNDARYGTVTKYELLEMKGDRVWVKPSQMKRERIGGAVGTIPTGWAATCGKLKQQAGNARDSGLIR